MSLIQLRSLFFSIIILQDFLYNSAALHQLFNSSLNAAFIFKSSKSHFWKKAHRNNTCNHLISWLVAL